MKKIRAGILGASGYTGQELVRLLSRHEQVEITALTSQTYGGKIYSDVFPAFTGVVDQKMTDNEGVSSLADRCDVLFFAVPHMLAAGQVDDALLQKTKVIDLSADFRLKNAAEYDTWYGAKHPRPQMLPWAVYGLPEWHRAEIATARLIANPGCYATCAILALLPMARHKILTGSVIVDAKSGVSGAGRSANLDNIFTECNESIKAYKVAAHRHTPEIEQELTIFAGSEVRVTFTPHLVPMNRGILVTAYCPVSSRFDVGNIIQMYESTYANEPFVHVLRNAMPETRWTRGSNSCHIGLALDKRTNVVIVVAALDNLVKGAAGQAVQNMNILFSLPETTGLTQLAALP